MTDEGFKSRAPRIKRRSGIVSAVILSIALLSAAPVAAQTPPGTPQATADLPAGARIAYVNLQVALSKSKLGQRGAADLQTLTAERDADLAAKQTAIADLESKASAAQPALSLEARNALAQDLTNRRAQLVFDEETWQIRVEQFSQELLANFRTLMLPVLDAIREERGLLLVLSLPHPGVVAADPGLDLSEELVRRLDERTK